MVSFLQVFLPKLRMHYLFFHVCYMPTQFILHDSIILICQWYIPAWKPVRSAFGGFNRPIYAYCIQKCCLYLHSSLIRQKNDNPRYTNHVFWKVSSPTKCCKLILSDIRIFVHFMVLIFLTRSCSSSVSYSIIRCPIFFIVHSAKCTLRVWKSLFRLPKEIYHVHQQVII
jgi:hypothetical protein